MDDTDISDDRTRTFATALRAFEQDADSAALAALFADGATALRFDARGERTDVEQFWREYRDQFSEIATTFTAVTQDADRGALEWTSEGQLSTGRPITYRGVTVIDLDGDKIIKLRTYYDSAAFTAVPAETSSAG